MNVMTDLLSELWACPHRVLTVKYSSFWNTCNNCDMKFQMRIQDFVQFLFFLTSHALEY